MRLQKAASSPVSAMQLSVSLRQMPSRVNASALLLTEQGARSSDFILAYMFSQRALSWHLPPSLFILCMIPSLLSSLRQSSLVYCVPLPEWSVQPFNSGYALMVFCNVCTHSDAFIFVSIARPSTERSQQSKIAEVQSFPSLHFTSVISLTALINGLSDLKSLFQEIIRFSSISVCFSNTVRFTIWSVIKSNFLHNPINRTFTRYIERNLSLDPAVICLNSNKL